MSVTSPCALSLGREKRGMHSVGWGCRTGAGASPEHWWPMFRLTDPSVLCWKLASTEGKEFPRVNTPGLPRKHQGHPGLHWFWQIVSLISFSVHWMWYYFPVQTHMPLSPRKATQCQYLASQSCPEESQDCWRYRSCSSNNHPHTPTKTGL